MRNFYYSEDVYDLKALTSHEEESFPLIQSVVKEGNFQLIVELGSAYYGMTLLFHECNRKTPLFTFDRYDARLYMSRARRKVSKEEVEILLKRGFGSRVSFVIADLVEKRNLFLISLLNISVKKLLYCDNGKKDREISYYGPELNSGDVLGVHDWKTEVNPDEIKDTLELFKPLHINKAFKEKQLLSRFFVKK
jgi:hypothetical protein